MKKRQTKIPWTIIGIILGVLIIASLIILFPKSANSDEKEIQCIAENSELYIQLGCSACVRQESLLGDYFDIFESYDCWYELEKCQEEGITATPTWKINGEYYKGYKTIEQLKELTGC